jgi:hypothetical protein
MNPTPAELFNMIAPSYDPGRILARYEAVFADMPTQKRQLLIKEMLKFLFLRSTYNKGFVPLTGEADEVWHEFILYTKEYEKFCQALPGGFFIHHTPMHLDEFCQGKDKKDVMTDLLQWLPNYYRHFGEFTAEAAECWFLVDFLKQELGFSLSDINNLCKSTTGQ